MYRKTLSGLFVAICLTACGQSGGNTVDVETDVETEPVSETANFSWFEYTGADEQFAGSIGDDQYRNPILAGYYPDPSVVRVGADFYMVNSTFGFYPGVPVHHSRDLVNWTQLGNVIDRPDMMPFDRLHLGQTGIYAPTIEHKDGTFYMTTTCIACGGNFIVTAEDPAGPWSDPVWLPHLEGIDPSIFFDDDGRMFIVHQRTPPEKSFDAHSALYVMEVDPETFEQVSDDVMLVDGATEAPWHTEYIEGPHIYKVDGSYILSAPGGGTGYYHGQLVYRSDNVFGPYEPYPGNPVLTQFGLPDDRDNPVTATGHADIFDDGNGNWWAVFLATRVYDLDVPPQDPGRFHTGRETFLLPVTWQDGWPIILEPGEAVPAVAKKPDLPAGDVATPPTTGNFTVREEFDRDSLAPQWLFIRTPKAEWWQMEDGQLKLEPRAERVGAGAQPSFIGRRLQHMTATVETELSAMSQTPGDEAGLLAIQNSAHYYAFGIVVEENGERSIVLRRRGSTDEPAEGEVLAQSALSGDGPWQLRMEIDKGEIAFAYRSNGEDYAYLLDAGDSSVLTTAQAGGFTGAVAGMYTQRAP
ncbi:glycoside hydrolase family 43 protein [Parvularcula flava]|uniref:Glycoside hydrolase 43 family protein n=1 Tax=Aquisalinus luteolus TaxID=1566827 RepID=A0A8J3AAT0_9PROT|nr:glycoside hydrolase family 43 protein [Aquisalinus luteolus]NHK29655.1 glycoside hydrolase family 43 protein [Aquisalinus luteolus]GGI02199.1 glycoside hydrolase 43 family protein [Aquisalinus luteolus]